MPDPNVAKLHEWLCDHEQDLLNDYRAVLQFPSIESEPLPNAPFGKANRDALDFVLMRAQEWGMTTRDLEGFCGWAEIGQGKRMVGAFGHLDVVPVGPGWKHQPFGAEIDGGYVYCRGAVDDKGPTMAAFYAIRAIQQELPDIGARLRMVFGCNEESGFKCMDRYNETEEAPEFGVAPDSGWPLYHAEKGIANFVTSFDPPKGEFELLEVAGGQRPNIVIDSAHAKLRVDPSCRQFVDAKLADAWDRNVTWNWEGDTLEVTARGKAAHGSTPFMGDSAGTRLFRFLFEIGPLSTESFFETLLMVTHPSGVGLGIHGRDDVSADLTSNTGIIWTEGGKIRLLTNIRYPVKWTGKMLEDRCREYLAGLDFEVGLEVHRDSPPLYFPLDHPLVKTICEVVKEETGEDRAPGVMGGGTYARAIPNTVSIGTGWEGDGKAHETDERLKVEHLFKMSRIYAHILYRLATL